MSEKKVIAVIVEGPSDENAIGGVLREYFSTDEVQFAVVHGDITSDMHNTVNNVVSKINRLIEEIKVKYGYEWKDFISVIHIADTDGVFTHNCVVQADVDSIKYFDDHMESPNAEAIVKRNEHKAQILSKLYSTGNVHKIRYRLYFNSCNLEHVLYGELKDFSDDEKEKLADDFADRYEGNLNNFIEFISGKGIAVAGTYKATWEYITADKHSLERNSNMHLIFAK